MEIIVTFALVFVIFATAVDRGGMGNLAPLAIGLTVLVDHLLAVPITGASMNPARSFGPALVADQWANHWIYWLAPLLMRCPRRTCVPIRVHQQAPLGSL
jgi:glycerol uptake facilitator-like aquaporin